MPYQPVFSEEKTKEIDAICQEVGITREQYIDRMCEWGGWIILHSRRKMKIAAIDPITKDYREMQDPILERLKPLPEHLN